jgi:hypothetical protein
MTDSTITPELLDQLLANYEKPEDLTGENGLFKQLKKALIERALGTELTSHLGYEKGDPAGRGSGNSRNGVSSKIRRLIFAESGVINPITQLCLLNSIANRHCAVSTCIAAGRLLTVRTVIRLSYALVVGLHRTGITPPAAPA